MGVIENGTRPNTDDVQSNGLHVSVTLGVPLLPKIMPHPVNLDTSFAFGQ